MLKTLMMLLGLMLALPVSAQQAARDIDFCLAKHEGDVPENSLSGPEHRALMDEYGFNCATVYWKLTSDANRANPYAWVRDQYLNNDIPVVMTLIIDDGTSTIGTSEGTDVSSGVPGLLYRVIRGDFDADLLELARAIKQNGQPITIRPLHEIDGGWYPWGMYAAPETIREPANSFALEREVYQLRRFTNEMTTNSPTLALNALAHVIRLFEVEGVDQVEWEVNFNRRDGKGQVLAEAEYLIPHMDAIGIDAYSISSYNRCGSSADYPEQRSFADEFAPIYERITSLTDKPIRVAEVSTTDFCAPKAQWFEQMFNDLATRFTRVDMVTILFGVVPIGRPSNTLEIDWSCGDDQNCIDGLKRLLNYPSSRELLRPQQRP